MEYQIEYNAIMKIVEEEVSREGAQAVTADGVSLYDAFRMVSRDEDKKKRLMSQVLVSVRQICNRLIKHVSLDKEEVIIEGEDGEEDTTEEKISFTFTLDLSPRRAAGKGDSLKTMFRTLTVNLFLNKFFASKNMSDLASKYDAAAVADIQVIAKLLYEKLPPVYPTIEHEQGS